LNGTCLFDGGRKRRGVFDLDEINADESITQNVFGDAVSEQDRRSARRVPVLARQFLKPAMEIPAPSH